MYKQTVGDGDGAERAIEPLVTPDLAARGDVALATGVEAPEGPPAAAMLRVTADGHVHPALVEHGRGDDLAQPGEGSRRSD